MYSPEKMRAAEANSLEEPVPDSYSTSKSVLMSQLADESDTLYEFNYGFKCDDENEFDDKVSEVESLVVQAQEMICEAWVKATALIRKGFQELDIKIEE